MQDIETMDRYPGTYIFIHLVHFNPLLHLYRSGIDVKYKYGAFKK